MTQNVIVFGPDAEVYNTYADLAASTSGGPGTSGTPVAGSPVGMQFRNYRELGTQLVLRDGRKFRFARVGASTLVTGTVQQSAAIITTDQAMTPLTGTPNFGGTIGDRSITFTHGAATVVLNYFAEGYAVVAVTNFDTYKIAAHLALTSAVAGDQVFLAPGNAIRNNALTASTTVSLYAHPYSMVVQQAATISGAPVGVALTAATTLRGCWLQTRGPCGVDCTGTILIGGPVVMLLTGGTAGTPAPATAATQPVIGNVLGMDGTPTGKAALLNLLIDG